MKIPRNMFILTPLLSVAISATALADQRGNGGHGIACKDQQGRVSSILFHDLEEGKYRYQLQPDLGPENLSVNEKLKLITDRLSRVDPVRGRKYAEEFAGWSKEVNWIDGRLEFIPDSNHMALPENCHLVQVAVQKPPQLPEEKFYLVDKNYYAQMGNDEKAAMIFHEILYKEAIAKGHKDSTYVRYLVALVSSSAFEGLSLADYIDRLRKTGLPENCYEWSGVPLSYQGLIFDENSNLIEGEACQKSQKLDFGIFSLFVTGKIKFHPNRRIRELKTEHGQAKFPLGTLHFSRGEFLTFDEHGTLIRIVIVPAPNSTAVRYFSIPNLKKGPKDPTSVTVGFWGYYDQQRQVSTFEMYPNGVPKSAFFYLAPYPMDRNKYFPVHEGYVLLEENSEVFFHPNGVMARGKLGSNTTLFTTSLEKKNFFAREILNFDESGRVIE